MATSFSPPYWAPPHARPPRSLSVVRDPPPDEFGVPIDWSSWYLSDEDDMGEAIEQQKSIAVFKSSIEELARERSWPALHVGADTFFAWVEREPFVRVSPDVYLLDDPPAPPMPRMISTWLPGHRAPRFAAEIVSEEWRKDYNDGPEKYAQLGARELVIFDPDAASGQSRHPERVPLQIYRRTLDGAFARVYVGRGPAPSAELGAFLVIAFEASVPRLRLARDPGGIQLVPTTHEAREVAEGERERERQAREAAEGELAALRAELARLKGG